MSNEGRQSLRPHNRRGSTPPPRPPASPHRGPALSRVRCPLCVPVIPPDTPLAGSRSAPPVAEDGPPPAAAEQVDIRAHVRERIARGIDAIHPGDWVEDDS